MIVIPDVPTARFDVDFTLVSPVPEGFESEQGVIYLPLSHPNAKHKAWFRLHQETVNRMKLHAVQGHNVIVWSGAGSGWAEVVVKAAGLEEFVTAIEPKGFVAYDDQEPHQFIHVVGRTEE